jgi:hypothetical protein
MDLAQSQPKKQNNLFVCFLFLFALFCLLRFVVFFVSSTEPENWQLLQKRGRL